MVNDAAGRTIYEQLLTFRRGTVEVVSSLSRDMSPVPNHLQWGTYVVVAADHEYVRRCAAEYCMLPD